MKLRIDPVYFVFLILGLVSITWFGDKDFLIGIDTLLPLSKQTVEAYFQIWSTSAFGGSDLVKLPVLFPYAFVIRNLFTVFPSMSPQLLERILLYMLVSSAGISAYFLSKVCFFGLERKFHFISGLFYLLNFYHMFILVGLPIYVLFSYSFFPLCLGLFIRLLDSKFSVTKTFVFSTVSFLMLTTSYATPPYIVIHFILFFAYFLYSLVFGSGRRFEITKSASLFVFFFLCLSLFWIYPFITSPKPSIESFDTGSMSIERAYRLNSSRVVDAFRMQGYFGFSSDYKGILFYPWFTYYQEKFPIIIGFIFVAIAFSGVFSPTRLIDHRKKYLFFLLIGVASLFLVSFSFMPFYEQIYGIIKPTNFLSFFRTAYQRFTSYFALSQSLMIGFSFYTLVGESKKRNQIWLLTSLLIILIVSYAFPLLTGRLFDQNELFPSKRIKFPSYYFEARDWMAQNISKEEYILPIPFNKLGLSSFEWNEGRDGYDGVYPLGFFPANKFLLRDSESDNGQYVQQALNDDRVKLSSLAQTFNISYLIIHNDINFKSVEGNSWWTGVDLTEVKRRLRKDACFSLTKTFGKLELYKVDARCRKGLVFAAEPKSTIYLSGSTRQELLFNSEVYGMRVFQYSKLVSIPKESNVMLVAKQIEKPRLGSVRWDVGWAWPDASLPPNPPFLKYSRDKEQQAFNKLGNDKLAQLEFLNWIAAKRLEEIEKWSPDEAVEKMLFEEYKDSISKMLDILSPEVLSAEGKPYFDLVKKAYFYSNRALELNLPQNVRNEISENKNRFQKILDKFEEYCLDFCYELKIPFDGDYDLKFDDQFRSDGSYKVYINNILLGITDERAEFRTALKEGTSKITLQKVNRENLLDSSDWVRKQNLDTSESEVGHKVITFYQKTQPKMSNYWYKKIEGWEPSRYYDVDLEYRVSGGKAVVGIFEEFTKPGSKDRELKLLTDFELTPVSSEGVIKFYVESGAGEGRDGYVFIGFTENTDSFLNSFSVEKLNMVKKARPHISASLIKSPAEMLEPDEYKPTANGFQVAFKNRREPFILVLADRFDPGFKVFENKLKKESNPLSLLSNIGSFVLGKPKIPSLKPLELEHFIVDSQANGWLVDPVKLETDRLVVRYDPEARLAEGVGISLTIFVVVSVILAVNFLLNFKDFYGKN